MHTNIETHPAQTGPTAAWDSRLNYLGWGLLLMMTGGVWLLVPEAAPPGSLLFGLATVLAGVNAATFAHHHHVSVFTLGLALCALVAAIGQMWRTDPPMLAIFVIATGASLTVRLLFRHGSL